MFQIDKERYNSILKEKYPLDDFTILSFEQATGPVKILCNKCNNIYEYKSGTTLYNKKRKHLCPLCNTKTMKRVYEVCKNEKIKILKFGKKTTDKYTLQCKKCQEKFDIIPDNWIMNKCPKCGYNKNMISIEERQKEINNLFGENEFLILSKEPATTNFIIQHKCGYIRKTQFSAFMRSPKCPLCSNKISKGEKAIIDYLEKNNITYSSQVKMGNTKQKFDFLINNKIVIEYNGEQHYKPVEIFGGEERFKQQILYDENKKNFCLKNNLTLLIISYRDYDNIETILDAFFKKFNDQSQDVKED